MQNEREREKRLHHALETRLDKQMPIYQTKNISKDQLIDAKCVSVSELFLFFSGFSSSALRCVHSSRPNHKNYIKGKSAEKLRSVIELFWHEAVPFPPLFLSLPSLSIFFLFSLMRLPVSALLRLTLDLDHDFGSLNNCNNNMNSKVVDEDLNVLLKVD